MVWAPSRGAFFRPRPPPRDRLAEKLGDAFDRVWGLAERDGISLRSAALVSGIRDVAAALEARGLYP